MHLRRRPAAAACHRDFCASPLKFLFVSTAVGSDRTIAGGWLPERIISSDQCLSVNAAKHDSQLSGLLLDTLLTDTATDSPARTKM